MNVELGKTEVSLLNPPNEGFVRDDENIWNISRTGSGNIILRRNGFEFHKDFLPDGMDMQSFCWWINSHL